MTSRQRDIIRDAMVAAAERGLAFDDAFYAELPRFSEFLKDGVTVDDLVLAAESDYRFGVLSCALRRQRDPVAVAA